MDQDEVDMQTQIEAKELNETFKPSPPKKEPPFKWIFALAFIFSLGVGIVWYTNLPSHHHLFPPPQSLKDPDLTIIKNIDFKQPLTQYWKEHVFNSPTSYVVENDMLHASSHGTSSMIYQEVNVDLSQRPFLTWDWKVIELPGNKQGKRLADKSNNDFAGRVYTIFKGKFPMNADVIQYVWDDRFPEGTFSDSPFLKSVKILVVKNGKSNDWVSEKRDLLNDYQALFGHPPRGHLSAVGIMSDSDNTKTKSEIYFRNLSLKKPKSNLIR